MRFVHRINKTFFYYIVKDYAIGKKKAYEEIEPININIKLFANNEEKE